MTSKETEVKTTSKRTTRKKSTASTKKSTPSVVEGEIVEAVKVKPKRNIVLSDNGDVNLSLIKQYVFAGGGSIAETIADMTEQFAHLLIYHFSFI